MSASILLTKLKTVWGTGVPGVLVIVEINWFLLRLIVLLKLQIGLKLTLLSVSMLASRLMSAFGHS